MVIGCLSLDLLIPGSNSLKDKRRVIKSLKDKIRSSFNVSVIEAPSDKWQRAKLAFASISFDRDYIEQAFRDIEEFIYHSGLADIISSEKEIF